MTREEFTSAVGSLSAPFWIAMRNGDQLRCHEVFDVSADRVSFLSDEWRRSVDLNDVQSLCRALQVGSPKRVEPFAPLLAPEQ